MSISSSSFSNRNRIDVASARKIRDNEGYERFLAYITEAGFIDDLKSICLSHRVTLREVYLDVRGPSVYAARIEIWWWMMFSLHKSSVEIGRIFDRDYSSVLHAITRLKERAIELGIPFNDAVGSHNVAKTMAKELTESRIPGSRKTKGSG